MKKFLGFFLILSLSFIACKKGDTGPAGPAGPQGQAGPQGPTGVAGNANVKQYTYGGLDFWANTYAQLQVTTTLDTMNRSQWFVYLYYQSLAKWYFVPGQGPGGHTLYRVSMGYTNNKVNIFIDKTGTGDIFSQARIIRIYASSESPGGRLNNTSVDFTDYNAVKQYYNLPD